MDQYIGRLLDDRYEILELIGAGGMAFVYKARCHRLNRLVAIKILKDEFAGDEEFRRRFRAEGEAVAMLSHPNIVQVYDVSSSESANYIVMELIDGISLKQYMENKGVLNWKETLHFGMQIAKGLEHAHGRGIIHRDIKPHNIMVLKNGSVKVMDFGIARVMNKSNTLTKEALGSVHYISPEQAKGSHTDSRSDLYSLGVVMYEMMTGRPPYDGESAVAVAIQHINGGAAMPSTLNPNIPGGLEQIIMKAMALEMRDRYASATEMLHDMEEFRKNPAILFDYHTLLDDATRAIPSAVQAQTLAEKKVQAKTGQVSTDSMRLRQAAQQRPKPPQEDRRESESRRAARQRQKAEEKKREEERSRVATTAIVICSAVVVIAIIVFLVALFNGALLNQEKDLVDVPYLQGWVYSDELVAAYGDFTIRLQPQQYSDTYSAGQIMDQEPAGGSRVQKGSDLWITVSMGPEPETKTMDNYAGVSADEAIAALTGMGYYPLTRKEASSVYEAGVVTRTDPASGAELSAGQTVYLYVSTGPEVQTQTMPNVLGLTISRAQELLGQMGFTNLRVEGVESPKTVDEVVYQSQQTGAELDVTAEIILHYSIGLETEPTTQATEPTTQPTQAPETTITITFTVPQLESDYTLDICTGGTTEVVASQRIPAGASSAMVSLTGSGTMTFDLYVNGTFEREQRVEFPDE